MREARRARWFKSMESSCFLTRMRILSANSHSICIRFVSRRGSCGASRRHRAISSTWICGIATLSASDFEKLRLQSDPARLTSLPSLPRDPGGPVFAEPWQAQAFALAVRLSEEGYFTWKEWASSLADELKAAADRGEPDDGSRYYEHWLAALE